MKSSTIALTIVVVLLIAVAGTMTYNNYQLANELVECAEILQYGSNSEIPISAELVEHASNLIEIYRAISINEEYQEILDKIENDLETFEGLTRLEILNEIE